MDLGDLCLGLCSQQCGCREDREVWQPPGNHRSCLRVLPIPTPTLETYSPCPAGFHWSEQALSILLRSLFLDPLLDSHLFIPQGSVGFRLLQEAFFACLLPASVLDKCCPPSPATISLVTSPSIGLSMNFSPLEKRLSCFSFCP